MITFAMRPDGYYRATVGNIDVGHASNGYELIVSDEVEDTGCDYAGCRNEDFDTDADCIEAHDGHCPMETKERQRVMSDLVSGLPSIEEAENRLRNQLYVMQSPLEAKGMAKSAWNLAVPVPQKRRSCRRLRQGARIWS